MAQRNPPYPCKAAHTFVALTDKARDEGGHLIRCRNRRCSLECAASSARKLDACLGFFLGKLIAPGYDDDPTPDPANSAHPYNTKSHLSDNAPTPELPPASPQVLVFRGHLTLPSGATPADHRAAKDRFLTAIRRARKTLGCVLEIHCNLHLTSPTDGHYDYLLYSDLAEPDLRALVRSAWQGRFQDRDYRYALIEVDAKYLDPAACYHAKANAKDRLLPVGKGEPGYLEATWHTSRFWGESSFEANWKALIEIWNPPQDPGEYVPGKVYSDPDDPTKDPISHRLHRAFDPDTADLVVQFPVHEAIQSRHEARLKQIARVASDALPQSAETAVMPAQHAERLRLHERWIDWDQIPRLARNPDGSVWSDRRPTIEREKHN